MAKIPSYSVRVQPLEGANAIIADPGSANYHVGTDLISGWVEVEESWSYASATTITIPAGGASRFQMGDKLRLKQGGSYKYFYIVAVADTLLTVTGGSDYTVANAAITDIYVSRAEIPFGFPDWFNWSPTLAGFSADPASGIYRFKITGRSVRADIRQPNTGTSNANNFTITAPVTASSAANSYWNGPAIVTDNGSVQTTPGNIRILASSPSTFDIIVDYTGSGTSWTNSGAKSLNTGFIDYEF